MYKVSAKPNQNRIIKHKNTKDSTTQPLTCSLPACSQEISKLKMVVGNWADGLNKCANCMKTTEGDEISSFKATGEEQSQVPESDIYHQIDVTVIDAISYIFDIKLKVFELLVQKTNRRLSNNSVSKSNEGTKPISVALCNDCTCILIDLYKLHSNFEKLSHSNSLIQQAKKYRCDTGDYALDNRNEETTTPCDDLFDTFHFDCDEDTGDVFVGEDFKQEVELENDREINEQSNLEAEAKLIVKLERISDDELQRLSERPTPNITSNSGTQSCRFSNRKLSKVVKYEDTTSEKIIVERNRSAKKYKTSSGFYWSPVTCKICGKVLKNMRNYKKHAEIHDPNRTPEPPVTCNKCGKVLKSADCLRKHNYNFHVSDEDKLKRKLQCHICNNSYASKNSLSVHILSHSTVKQKFTCSKCDQIFTQEDKFKLHLKAHESTSIFKCKKCDREFPIAEYLEQHERVHNSDERYKCSKCPKTFTYKRGIYGHMKRVHCTDAPCVCDQCGRIFTSTDNLRIHLRLHEDEKQPTEQFKCKKCGKLLKNSRGLMQHMINVHKKDIFSKRSYECKVCGKIVKDRSNFKKHEAIHIKNNE